MDQERLLRLDSSRGCYAAGSMLMSRIVCASKTGRFVTDTTYDVAVIGGGPAGQTASTYLARYRRRVLTFDTGQSRANWIPKTHNCPGFPFGISGPDLLRKLSEQSRRYGVQPVAERVQQLLRQAGHFVVVTDNREYQARAVLLATGVTDVLPDIDGIDHAIQAGIVRLCAICDAYEARDERIAVLGRDLDVVEHARFLRTFSADVTVLLQYSVSAGDWNSRCDDDSLKLVDDVTAMACDKTQCVVTAGGGTRHHFDTLYPILGSQAHSDLATQLGARTDSNGELMIDDQCQTSVPGLYAAGDVVHDLNQISVAVGQAAIAATSIHRSLPSNYA